MTNIAIASQSLEQESLPMSFREKSAWACLITTIAIWGPYFAYAFRLFTREHYADSIMTAFIVAVILSIVLNGGAHIAIAFHSRKEKKDERDIAIESKSYRNAYFVLIVLIWMVILAAPLGTPARHFGPVFLSQMVLLCFVVAEAAKYLTTVVCYRRGC
jgi:hypothetical protein